jgi:cold shock CspA family protein/uncharacterized protein YbjQ (UPF0145 family)
MNGKIKTYLPSKKYGFIKGDDEKDYYFRAVEFADKNQLNMICEDAFVAFEERATPKGYRAVKCSLINPSDILTYTVPDSVIISRSNIVNGWDIMEYGNWIVHGGSENSLQEAKNDAIEGAVAIGANALIDFDYYKTTGSSGNYKFTIHNFRGRAVTIAKRKANGQYKADVLSGLNQRAELRKESFVRKTNSNRKKRYIIHGSVITLSISFLIGALLTNNPAFILPILPFFIVGRIILMKGHYLYEYGSWLERG